LEWGKSGRWAPVIKKKDVLGTDEPEEKRKTPGKAGSPSKAREKTTGDSQHISINVCGRGVKKRKGRDGRCRVQKKPIVIANRRKKG